MIGWTLGDGRIPLCLDDLDVAMIPLDNVLKIVLKSLYYYIFHDFI